MNQRLFNNRHFLVAQKVFSVLIILSFAFGDLASVINLPIFEIKNAEAAQVTIDSAAEVTGASHLHGPGQSVFISDQVGYKFYRDAPGYCVYKKTSDGGSTWSSTTTVDSQTDCVGIAVWYDRWTPGDTGTNIHIVTIDTGNDDPWYNRLDTNGDTLLRGSGPVSTIVGPPAQGANTIVALANYPAITKATNGTVYVALSDNVDSYIVRCSTSCQTAANWTEAGPTGTLPATPDFNLLMPLAGGDILLINRLVASEDIRSKVWNNTAGTWSGTWTTIEGNGTDNATYPVGMAATVSSTTPGNVYLAYIASNATLGTDDQVRTHRYTGGAWATTTSVLTGTARGLTNVAIALDASNDDVYVAYTGRTTAATLNTGNVYWKRSTDDMVTWEAEKGPINTAPGDMYGIDLNTSSNERIYASWFDNNIATPKEIYGDTVVDVFSGVHATTTGTHTATTNASTTDFYVGGAFVLYQNYKTQDVTDITITENGTIDGDTNIANVKLLYEMDTTAPYNCASVSYGGGESQFGSTDTSGFSGANGVSTFTGTTVSVGTTSAMCGYVVLDILNSTPNASTIDLSIANPSTDITVTDATAGPSTAQAMAGSTSVLNDNLTQSHFHWRNDNGTQATATSKTAGTQDTNFTGYQRTPVRLRFEVSNEGGSTSAPTAYRLEYGLATTTCAAVTSWTDVGATGGDFDMSPSANITDGNDTTNIATAVGGMTDENTTFKTPNGAVKDTSSQTGTITLTSTQYVDLEYSITASTTAADGDTYCMRLTAAGRPLDTYTVYPQLTIQADVNLTTRGTQTTNLNVPSTNQNVGAQFVLTDATGSHSVTSIKLTENGTVNAQTGLDNIRLKYDLDTSAPYDCASESYAGAEAQFGATSTASFSGSNGTTTFSGSVGVTTTQTVCLYVVADVTTSASNGETIEIEISNATTDVTLASGSSAPAASRALPGTTTLVGAILTQSRYHFRADVGGEATSTSLTSGIENTAITNVSQSTPVRIRIEVSNEGTITSPNTALRLEYGTKITSCTAVGSWTDVGETLGAFDMYASLNLTEGGNTTNIAAGIGGVTNDNTTFKTPNSAVKDTSSQVATTTLTSTQYIETEFSIRQTADAAYDTTYCFRLSNAGIPINAYTAYPELTTSPERDFEIQRNFIDVSGTGATLVAGVDYVAPSASTSAFIRITNSNYTGAGNTVGGGTQNSDDVTAYISNPSNIMTSVTIARPSTATAVTRVYWEIIEFIGTPGSDNEMKVRSQSSVTYTTTSLTATGTAATGIVDDTDVVVFITGQFNPDILATDYNTGQSVSSWLSSSDEPAFRRGEASGDASRVSYAVVEFTGVNWKVQRASHTYTAVGTTETEAITAVNSLSRTFIHSQKYMGTALQGEDEFGHEVWLSSIGAVSFFLQTGATSPTLQTSVAWIIENTQTSGGAMVVTRKNNFTNGGVEPLTLNMPIDITLSDLTNASIFANNRAVGTGTLYPRPIAGFTIASTTHFRIWRSDTGTQIDYRVEIVEWPTAGLALHQNDYRFYVDNNALDPTDPWPIGTTSDLGENTVITGADEPLGDAEHIRIRMTATVFNATLPEYTLSNKLQFGKRVTTCSAISEVSWTDIGNATSSTIWRGYPAAGVVDGTSLSTDPPAGGALNITASDVSATYEENNNSAVNPFTADEGEDIEYDWHVQQNGADAETFYCFRMVDSSGATLGAYDDYPQLRTSSFTAKTQNWRWYSDVNSETPTVDMALENFAPIDLRSGSTTKLRVTVKEVENIARNDVRFKLQYSEYADFSNTVFDVIATSSCIASSTWCYFNGGGTDNAVISTKVLTDADSCIASVGDGCGTHNEGPQLIDGYRHENSAAAEYEFTLQAKAVRANAVYYFRLYDITQDIPVPINTGETYPSVVAAGASLVFAVDGLTSGTVTEGVTLDVTSTPTSIPYGTLSMGTEYDAAYRLNVNTNATEGYQVLMYADQLLVNSYGSPIPGVTGTNAVPTNWSPVGCSASAIGCFGYHAGDDSLGNGSARFGSNDSYAALSTSTPQEVMYSSIPVNDTHDIVYKLKVTDKQPAGNYQSTITYIVIPTY